MRNFNEIFRKNVSYDNIKSQKKNRVSPSLQKIHFLKNHREVGGQIDPPFPVTCCRFYLKLTSSFLSAELTDNTFPLNSYFISFLKLGKSKSIFCHPFFFHSLENNGKILFHLLELSEVLNLMTQSSIFHIYPYWKKLTITHFIACYTIATILRLSTLSGCQNHVFWTFLKICYA